MLDLYGVMFALPAIVSILLLLILRRVDDFSAGRWILLSGWYVVAFALQFFGRSPTAWVVGLVLQVGLAIYLSLRIEYAAA